MYSSRGCRAEKNNLAPCRQSNAGRPVRSPSVYRLSYREKEKENGNISYPCRASNRDSLDTQPVADAVQLWAVGVFSPHAIGHIANRASGGTRHPVLPYAIWVSGAQFYYLFPFFCLVKKGSCRFMGGFRNLFAINLAIDRAVSLRTCFLSNSWSNCFA